MGAVERSSVLSSDIESLIYVCTVERMLRAAVYFGSFCCFFKPVDQVASVVDQVASVVDRATRRLV